MHLKTLTLRGFKSFASATTLHMEPGITAVVGPNGSGKSNVVDALAWVMGEQGAKSLRGANMADVIFAGTHSKAALGRAEVKLTIDNSDGALPIEYSEVTISRTLFRGGGSEYSINGTPCRLLDIQELLSDTGMGRQMHVIVGQGQLDAVLTATPEERRGFIEEAAGVLKHRRRKERAERKLENMAANLNRLEDLTTEIRRQLGPLARQADVARRASVIQATVRDARSRLLADDVVQLQDDLEARGANEEQLQARRAEIGAVIGELRARLHELETEALSGTPVVEEATQVWQSLTSVHERLRSVGSLASERLRMLSEPITYRGGADPEELEKRAEAATAEDVDLLRQVEAAQTGLEEATTARVEAETLEREAERELAQVNRARADRRENLARLAGREATAKSRLEAAQAETERARQRLEEAKERLVEAQREVENAPQVDEGENPAAHAHAEAVAKVDELRDQVDRLLEVERQAGADQATWTSRRDTLEISLRPDDGTGDLLAAKLPGLIGALPALMKVPEAWQQAVTAALGWHADAAVVESVAVAVDAIRQSRENQGGLVRLVVAESGFGEGQENLDEASLPAGAVWASEVVTVKNAKVKPLVKRLLSGVALAADLAQARQIIADGTARAVATADGDFLSQTVVTGAAAGENTTALSLHAAYQEAQVEAEAAAQKAAAAAAELIGAREALQQANEEAEVALAALRAADAQKAELAQQAASAAAALRSAGAEVERAEDTLAQLEAEVVELSGKAAEAKGALEQFQADAGPALDADEATKKRDQAAKAAHESRQAETEARLKLRTLEERSRSAKDRARGLRQQAAREKEAAQQAVRREAQRQVKYERMVRIAQAAEKAVAAAATSLELAALRRQEVEAQRMESSQQVTKVRQELDEQNRRLAELTDAAHRGEVAQAEVRTRLNQLIEDAQEELGMDVDALVAEYGPHNLVPVLTPENVAKIIYGHATRIEGSSAEDAEASENAETESVGETESTHETQAEASDESPEMIPYVRAEQEKRLAKATRDLAKLGKVNPLALEEHAALTQRYEFLTKQLSDLKQSRADLRQIIADVDQRVQEVFTQAFADTQAAFAHVFDRLFPGGEGRLVLTEPDDMLTTGIEIEARPAGKKVKRLSLLSGGERSLAALALLLAIFKARPSPFYVLDEVEAALDDANLGRLLEMLKELRQESQLIIITHQKRTMEIADALYGVTMRHGVTTVISQRLESE